jgi:hypothetical protein
MKIKIAVATVALSLVGAIGAQAQESNDFSVVVSPNPLNLTAAQLPVGDQAYSATITNTSSSADTIVGDSIGSLPTGVNIVNDGIMTQLGTTGPIALAAGGSVTVPDAFDLAIPAGTQSFVGDLTVYDNAGNGNNVASVGDASVGNPYGNFAVNTTPEPGTLALLASSALGGGAFLLRRRRS